MTNPFLNYTPMAPGSALPFEIEAPSRGNLPMRFGADIKDMAASFFPGIMEIGSSIGLDAANLFTGAQRDFRTDDLGKDMLRGLWESPVIGGAIRTNPFDVALDTILKGPSAAFSEQKKDIGDALSGISEHPGYALMDASLVLPMAGGAAKVARATKNPGLLKKLGHKEIDTNLTDVSKIDSWSDRPDTLTFTDGTTGPSKLYGSPDHAASPAPLVTDDGRMFVWQSSRSPSPKFWDDIDLDVKTEAGEKRLRDRIEEARAAGMAEDEIAQVMASTRQRRSMNPLSAKIGDTFYANLAKLPDDWPVVGEGRRWARKASRALAVQQAPIDSARAKWSTLSNEIKDRIAEAYPDLERDGLHRIADEAAGAILAVRALGFGGMDYDAAVARMLEKRGLNQTNPVTLRPGDDMTVQEVFDTFGIEITRPSNKRRQRTGGQDYLEDIRQMRISDLHKEQLREWQNAAKNRYGRSWNDLDDDTRMDIMNDAYHRQFEAYQLSAAERAAQERSRLEKAPLYNQVERSVEHGLASTNEGASKGIDVLDFNDLIENDARAAAIMEGTRERYGGRLLPGMHFEIDGQRRDAMAAHYAAEGTPAYWSYGFRINSDITKDMIEAYGDVLSDRTGSFLYGRNKRNPDLFGLRRTIQNSEAEADRNKASVQNTARIEIVNKLMMALLTGNEANVPRLVKSAQIDSRMLRQQGADSIDVPGVQAVLRMRENLANRKRADQVPMGDRFRQFLAESQLELEAWRRKRKDDSVEGQAEIPAIIRMVRTLDSGVLKLMGLDMMDMPQKSQRNLVDKLHDFEADVAERFIELWEAPGDKLFEDTGGVHPMVAAWRQVVGEMDESHPMYKYVHNDIAQSEFMENGKLFNDKDEYQIASDMSGPYVVRRVSSDPEEFDILYEMDPDEIIKSIRAGEDLGAPDHLTGLGREHNLALADRLLNEAGRATPMTRVRSESMAAVLKSLMEDAVTSQDGKYRIPIDVDSMANAFGDAVATASVDSKRAMSRTDPLYNPGQRRHKIKYSEDPSDSFALASMERQLLNSPEIPKLMQSATKKVTGDGTLFEQVVYRAKLEMREQRDAIERGDPEPDTPSVVMLDKIIEQAKKDVDEMGETVGMEWVRVMQDAYPEVRTAQGSRLESAHSSQMRKELAENIRNAGDNPTGVIYDLRDMSKVDPKDRRVPKRFTMEGGIPIIHLEPRQRVQQWQDHDTYLDEDGVPQASNPNSDFAQGIIEQQHHYGPAIRAIQQDSHLMERLNTLADEILANSKDAAEYVRSKPDGHYDYNDKRWAIWMHGEGAPIPEDTIHMPVRGIDPDDINAVKRTNQEMKFSFDEGFEKTPKERVLQRGPAIKDADGRVIRPGYRSDFSNWFDDFAKNRKNVGLRAMLDNAMGYAARVEPGLLAQLNKDGLVSHDVDAGTPFIQVTTKSNLYQNLIHMAHEFKDFSDALSNYGVDGVHQMFMDAMSHVGAADIGADVYRMDNTMRRIADGDAEEFGKRMADKSREDVKARTGKDIDKSRIDPNLEQDAIIIPRQVYDLLSGQIAGYDNIVIKALQTPLEIWKTTVLQLRAAGWIRNNIFGSALMFLMSGNPVASWRAIQTVYKSGTFRERLEKRVKEADEGGAPLSPEESLYMSVLQEFPEVVTDSGSSRGIAEIRRIEDKKGGNWLDRKMVPYFNLMNRVAGWNAKIADTPWRAAHAIRTLDDMVEVQRKYMLDSGAVKSADELPDKFRMMEDMIKDPRVRVRIAEETLGDMVDFGDMSRKERQVIGMLFPFWSWMKGSAKAYLRMASNRPGTMMAMNEIGQLGAITSNEELGETLPDYMRTMWKIPGTDNKVINFNGMNPWQTPPDLMSLASSLVPFAGPNRRLYGADNIFGSANPLLKAIVENATGDNLFMGTAKPNDTGFMTGVVKDMFNVPGVKFAGDMILGPGRHTHGIPTSATEQGRWNTFLNYTGIPTETVRPHYAWKRGQEEANELWGSRWAYPALRQSIPGAQ